MGRTCSIKPFEFRVIFVFEQHDISLVTHILKSVFNKFLGLFHCLGYSRMRLIDFENATKLHAKLEIVKTLL